MSIIKPQNLIFFAFLLSSLFFQACSQLDIVPNQTDHQDIVKDNMKDGQANHTTLFDEERKIPTPGDNQLLIQAKANLLCGSDRNQFYNGSPQCIPGHEGAGVIVEKGSVLSMGCYIGQSTKIINRSSGEIAKGRIPPYSVVVPGTYKDLYAVHIIKTVDEKTRSKTSINDLLRE